MLFSNARFAKLTKLDVSSDDLQAKLKEFAYKPAEPSAATSCGWVSPFHDYSETMALSQDKSHLLSIKIEEKSVPASVIKNELDKKISASKLNNPSLKFSKKEISEMKERIAAELLPKVLPSFSYINLYLDLTNGLLVINTTSDNKCDFAVDMLRKLLGSDFAIAPFDIQTDPSQAMTYWISEWDIPAGFIAGDECKLKDSGEEKTEITYKKHDLKDESIREYLSSMLVTKLALEIPNEISFQLDANACLSKIKFLDVYKEKKKESLSSDSPDAKSAAAELDVDFAIMRGAFKELLPRVVEMFKADN